MARPEDLVVAKPQIRLYTSIKQGQSLAGKLEGPRRYRHTIRDIGGFWSASWDQTGTESDLLAAFQSRLGWHVEERRGGVTWEGLISEMDLTIRGVTRRRSLEQLANSVRANYIDENNERQVSTWTTNKQSIARYGTYQEELPFDGYPEATVQAAVDRFLNFYAWPVAKPFRQANPDDPPLLEVFCSGYVHTAQNKFHTLSDFDVQQGTLAYLTTPDRFDDSGQDFSEWDVNTGGIAHYSIRVWNTDGTFTWAYLKTAGGTGNREIQVFQDQACTTAGWNGQDPTGLTPGAYFITGPLSSVLTTLIENDCEYLEIGRITENLLQVRRSTEIQMRAWDLIEDLVQLGDENGNPYRFYVGRDRQVIYEPVTVTPKYFIKRGILVSGQNENVSVDPWIIQPAVARDLQYPGRNPTFEYFLENEADVYMEEIIAGVERGASWRIADYEEAELFNMMTEYEAQLEREAIGHGRDYDRMISEREEGKK